MVFGTRVTSGKHGCDCDRGQSVRLWRRGMLVMVKSASDVRATLDDNCMYDGLPFTAEMWKYCGKVFTVARVVNRIYIEKDSVRALPQTLVLESVRCDGSAHMGCQRLCQLLFKDVWLTPCDTLATPVVTVGQEDTIPVITTACHGQACVLRQASTPLPFWQPRQYFADFQARNYGLRTFLRMCWYMYFLHRHHTPTNCSVKTPAQIPSTLGLRVGELVEVRSQGEIAATLDSQGKCRGLYFSHERMGQYCGKRFRVLQPVEHIIDEDSGRMVTMKDTVYLADVTCDGTILRGCPRDCYWLWREAWLKRVT
ncbi:MAG TPA: hypothetical protein VHV83_11670 [Armatimonadota bacterium]|nr:hypothetical protein [Armatimonadota bacterium]